MDRRQQKTRDAIFSAFTGLLAQKNYSKITVQEIIDRANVGRTTFYAHFPTKDHLLREMCADLFDHIFSDSPGIESTHDFSLTAATPDIVITHILYHLRDSKKNIVGLLTGESSELFLGFFRDYLNQLLAGHMLVAVDEDNSLLPYDFLVSHVSGAFVNLVQWWLARGLQEAPEELASYFSMVIEPVIASITAK
ncbi:MAG: TetR/AcrR family transcriptional regulator [Bacillota bacterium]|nr:TetR/AcrR family transcriptional regulator [Bacillota bacterium]